MTISRPPGRSMRAARFAGALCGIVAAWFVILAIVPVLRDVPGQYLVMGTDARRLRAVEATPVQLISAGQGYTLVATASPGQVAQLYAHGAWVVLPAGNGGCLRLSDWQRLQGR